MTLRLFPKYMMIVVAGAASAGLLTACSSGTNAASQSAPASSAASSALPSNAIPSSSPPSSSPPSAARAPVSPAPAAARSGYISLADYERDPAAFAGSDVVLFFRADWCHECRETDDDLKASKDDFPASLVVVNVDYDENTDLKKEYGVTHQHTFVEIAPDGAQVKKWSGTLTAQAIAGKV